MSEILYRTFRNQDPPHLLRLWHQCELGRGAARPRSVEAFEQSIYSQTYFDPEGLVLAESEGRLVGWCHAGFGFLADRSGIDPSRGVICVILVHPEFRRRGIGRELLRRAEAYLLSRGAESIVAGESRYCDPFYFGLYGGSRPSGFLDSDPLAAPFFQSLDYTPDAHIAICQRDLTDRRDPMNMRLVGIRRRTQLAVADGPMKPDFWWYCHLGRMESLRFRLVDRKTLQPVAAVTVIALDHYIDAWNERAIGLVDLFVSEDLRGQGYGQTLLVETVRRIRQERFTRVDLHVPEQNPFLMQAALSAGFQRIETGTVYRRQNLPVG